jgi:kynureninase
MTTSESRMHNPAPVAIEHPELVAYRSEFPILQRKTYLNSCSLGALSNCQPVASHCGRSERT